MHRKIRRFDRRARATPGAGTARARTTSRLVATASAIVARLRRTALLAALTACGAAATQAAPFGFDTVAADAQALARQPYRAPPKLLQSRLEQIGYDAWRDIRFRPQHALWRGTGLPFEVMFFHAAQGYAHPVKLHEVVGGRAYPIRLPQEAFDFGRNVALIAAGAPAEPAGFRVHYPLNRHDYKDELIVFLGASYFRAVGAGQHYGLSARGIAIDSAGAEPGRREEFPLFESFWIERPAPGAHALVVHALLNGPRVAGAYRFVVTPGSATVVDVQARLYLRERVSTLGIAPLTSMFLAGENQPAAGHFRPEVHDSDGLQIASGTGEWIWRPLTNPKHTFVTSFRLDSLQGFGLMQRDRSFASYEDIEARYDRRPSVWIAPRGDWGAGRVELLQLHTPDETNDNVVAYWVPARVPRAGEPLDFAYRMHWHAADAAEAPHGRVLQSRRGRGYAPPQGDEIEFHVDFDGPALRRLPADANVNAIVTTDANAGIRLAHAYRNPANGTWRMTLKVERREARSPVELRAFLAHDADVLTETWAYAIPPE